MNTVYDINFIEHGGIHGKQLGIFMPGLYWVPKDEVLLSWEIANATLHEIDWTKKVCTETILSPEIWRQFATSMKYRLGRCLKFFSDQELLPIDVANPGKKGKRFYKKKGE